MQEIQIRQAGRDDARMLSEIIRNSFRDVAERFGLTPENCPKHPSNCDESWVERDMDRGVTYYLLQEDGRSAGCVALERSAPHACFLERLAVLPESRARGHGKRLVHHVLKEAERQGFDRVAIAIIAEHLELKDWYVRLGFVEEETKDIPHLPFRVMFLIYELS